jgi:lambda family phage portal protein
VSDKAPTIGLLDRMAVAIAPSWGLRRIAARRTLDAMAGVHEATKPGRNRKRARDGGDGNTIVGMDHRQLRDTARHLERDLDLARGVLNTLQNNVVGTGIDVEPLPRLPGQPVDEGLARDLSELFADWWDRPEVTWQHDAGSMQQLLCRSWLRDGEALYQHVQGTANGLDHGTRVPYSVEMIEADMLPLELTDTSRGIRQGIEVSDWGRPIAYHLFKAHPSDAAVFAMPATKRVLASSIEHLAMRDRIRQLRGLSLFASAMNRLEDIKDYEDSERIAAKVAASLTAFIRKGQPQDFGSSSDGTGMGSSLVVPGKEKEYRDLRMTPGLIMDDLLPGEEIGLIDSKRPNPNAALFREGQLRAVSRGVNVTFSSLSGNYNGTYSAQRQELVEQWAGYAVLGELFIAQCVRPMWRKFVESAVLAGLIKLPRGWNDLRYLQAASFVRPAMPWINPLHEVEALAIQEDRLWITTPEIIRRRSGDPQAVIEGQTAWEARLAAANLQPKTGGALPADTQGN